MAQTTEKMLNGKSALKWFFCLIVPAIVYFALPIDGKTLTHEMAMFLVVTILMVCIWGFELVNDTATGLVLPVLYMALCGVPGKIAYNNWLGDVPNIVIGGFIFCKILQDTGLGKRVGLGCMKLMGGSFIGTVACDLYYQSARSRGNGQGCHFLRHRHQSLRIFGFQETVTGSDSSHAGGVFGCDKL